MSTLQNIVIDGKDYGRNPAAMNSKFHNTGKWNNFIKPLLPENCEDMTFVEIGCNGGLFLKEAKEYGFRRVIGIEGDSKTYGIAKKFMEVNGMSYEVRNEMVDRGFNFDSLPLSDVILLANIHYHIQLETFLPFVNWAKRKAISVIIVSSDKFKDWRKAKWDIESLRAYFKDWKETGYIEPLDQNGDPAPRFMFSVRFDSGLERIPLNLIYDNLSLWRRRRVQRVRKTKDAYPMNNPILIHRTYQIIDGTHRLANAMRDGFKSVIVEYCP